MSFITPEDIYETFDGLIQCVFKAILGIEVKTPIPAMDYAEAAKKYGSDKPDLRFALEMDEIQDLVTEFMGEGIPFFENDVKSGGIVKALKLDAKHASTLSRADLQNLEAQARTLGATGLGQARMESSLEWKSPLAKFIKNQSFRSKVNERLGLKEGDMVFFNSGKEKQVNVIMNDLRLGLGKRFKMINEKDYQFVWITNFPMFEYSEEGKSWTPTHHPFTAPTDEDLPLLSTPEFYKAKAKAYDIVLNGNELGGGSIRIHDRETQKQIFKLLGIGDEEAQSKFGFLLDAFQYGAPPHGGIALGLDRLVMLILGLDSIREVIAFPKTSTGASLMDGAPSEVSPAQLKELGIRIVNPQT
jgi:aspartyl-tRNA synthetase